MPQASLTTWFKKPAAVTQPPNPTEAPDGRTKADDPHTPPLDNGNDTEKDASTNNPSKSSTPQPTAFIPPNLPPLPANVELRACTAADIPTLKRLNSLLLPIPYPENFYREILSSEQTNNITLLALWHDKPATTGDKNKEKGILVGAIRCRILPETHQPTNTTTTQGEKEKMLYLSTLVLLSPYRDHGIASHMLSIITARGVRAYGVRSVGAHVWEANAEGREWYGKRGFVEVGREEGYYRKLRPQGAVVLRRAVGVGDLLGAGGWG